LLDTVASVKLLHIQFSFVSLRRLSVCLDLSFVLPLAEPGD